MARRMTTSESKQTREKMESQKEMRSEQMRSEQTTGRGTALATPSSWWIERLKIERPNPEDQEPHYRQEQARYEQERQRATYYRPIEEIVRSRPEDQEPRYREEQMRYGQGKPVRAEQEGYKPQMKEEAGEKKDIFQIWADSYAAVSRTWEDTYQNLYKPWIEATGDIYSKAIDLSENATPENYREFYNEWIKTYQNTLGKLYPGQFDKEIFEKLMKNADESKNLFQSWISMIDENSRKTQELLQGTPDPEKYRELYDTWMRTYGKIFEDFVEMPTKGSTKEILESYGGVAGAYLKNFSQMAKLLNESYMNLYRPWVDSMLSLSEKMAEISRGEARPEAYKEFYNLWMDAYRKTYGQFDIRSAKPAAEKMADSFLRSMNVYLNMQNSWMDSLGKISQKTMDISKRATEPGAYKEFYNNWARMYERSFDEFFKYVPMAGPMRSMMEPVKNAAKTYTDMYTDMLENMSNMWMRPVFGSTIRA